MDSGPAPALQALQERLGYRYTRADLLRRALTHRSWGAEHNERLEFLGDAVLSLAVSRLLYERHADRRITSGKPRRQR
jgi:ribonuclease-3